MPLQCYAVCLHFGRDEKVSIDRNESATALRRPLGRPIERPRLTVFDNKKTGHDNVRYTTNLSGNPGFRSFGRDDASEVAVPVPLDRGDLRVTDGRQGLDFDFRVTSDGHVRLADRRHLVVRVRFRRERRTLAVGGVALREAPTPGMPVRVPADQGLHVRVPHRGLDLRLRRGEMRRLAKHGTDHSTANVEK